MLKLLVLPAVLLVTATVQAQQPYSDCDKAIVLDAGTSKYILLSGSGTGEIHENNQASSYWFNKEHHTCWVKLAVKNEGELIIDIEPGEPADVNFLLFSYNGGSFCNDIKEKKVMPVRANLSPGNGKTGLSTGAKDELVSATGDVQFSRSIPVRTGDVYYLVVDHNSVKGGSVLVGCSVSGDATSGRAPVQVDKNLDMTVPLSVKILDDESGQPVVAGIAIQGLVPSETVKQNTSVFNSSLSSSQSIRIDCNATGYMFATHSLIAPALDANDPATFRPVNVEIRLKKIKEGDKVTLTAIKFQPDKADFMPGSYPSLQALVAFLQNNPDVKIEIGGHINGPDGSSAAGKAMSKKRAKAVYDYLIKSGIGKARLRYKGYGNTQMIHPAPLNERQADENRRVEIKIISK